MLGKHLEQEKLVIQERSEENTATSKQVTNITHAMPCMVR